MRVTAARALLCAVFAVGTAHGSERPLIGPAPEWALPAKSVDASSSTDLPVQPLIRDQQVRLTGDTTEFYSASRFRIQTPQGLGAVGTLGFAWNPDTDEVTVHQLTATRNGQARDLLGDGRDLTILRREDQLEQAILTGTLTAVLQPPDLQVGDVIDMRYTLRRRDPVVADTPDGTYIWPNTSLGSVRLRAIWPESMPLRWRASEHMPAAEPIKRDGWYELSYEMDDPAPLLQPTGAPGRFAALRMVELSAFRDWAHLAQRMAPLYSTASTLAADSPLRAEAARIRQQHRAPTDQAAAALRLVQDQIRYVLLAMNDGGLVPAAADETWQRRFGDCKAKTAVLLALLRELDIDADPVAVSSAFGDGMDTRLPAIGLFDHVLVRARIDGVTYWLDGTRTGDRSLARMQPPPFQWALPLVERGGELVAIPRDPLHEPEVVRTLDIDASQGVDTAAPFQAELVMQGDAALSVKLAWDGVPAVMREERLRGYWREQLRGAQIDTADLAFEEQTGRMVWKASGEIQMEWDPEYNTYQPHGMQLGYRADFTRPRGTDADAPYAVEFPVFTRTVEIIRLPPGQHFTTTGSDIDRTIAGTAYTRKAAIEGNRFQAEVGVRSVLTEFPASERLAAERDLLEMSRNTLYLKKQDRSVSATQEVHEEVGQAQQHYTRGTEMMRRGLIDDGIAAFTLALQSDPRHLGARMALAAALHDRGEVLAGIELIEAGLEMEPDESYASRMRETLSRFHVSAGKPERAIPLLDALLAQGPNPRLNMSRAIALRNMGRWQPAHDDAQAVLADDPLRQEAHFLTIEALATLGRAEESLAAARRYAATQPRADRADPEFMVAKAIERAGLRDLAVQYYDRGLAISANPWALVARAALLDDKRTILAELRKAMGTPGAPAAIAGEAARVLLEREWYREAVEILSWYDDEIASTHRATGNRGIARWKLGDRAGAIADFDLARDLAPAEPALNELCRDKAMHNVALDEALKDCDTALASLPACPPCIESRAFVMLLLNRFEEAEEGFDQAMRHQATPTSMYGTPTSIYGRGIARIRNGNLAGGEQDLARAIALSPEVNEYFSKVGLHP